MRVLRLCLWVQVCRFIFVHIGVSLLIPLEIYKITKSNFKHIFVVLGFFFAFEEKFCLCFLAFFLWGDFLILMRVVVWVSKTMQSGEAD